MNHCVTDWIMEDGSMSFHDLLPSAGLKRSTRPENELVELLWQNGHVVMHSQTNRKATTPNEIKQCQKPESVAKYVGPLENSTNVIHDGETVSWLQYPDDSLEKEFYTDIFYGLPTTESTTMDKLKDVIADEDKFTNYGATEESNIFAPSKSQQPINHQFEENVMPPPKSQVAASYTKTASAGSAGVTNFSHFSRPPKAVLQPLNGQLGEKSSGDRIQGEVGESSSVMTKGSSFCGSNQVQNPFDVSWSNAVTVPSAKGVEEESQTRFSQGRAHSDIHETAVTSSSGGSGCSYGRTGQQSGSMRSHKRKGRDADESECQSEEDVDESVEANRPAQRSANARRSRAAEVHNLSERRRRDRINEKMRALQELIPHCNKTDKASMLDEAIEYLKSLQLQVQMMWMGSGMTPMMFPGVQHFMSRMGMGMGHGPVPSIHGPIQFPRVPLVGQSLSSNPSISQTSVCPSPGISPVSFQSQVQNAHLPESYARYLGFQHMQPSPQAMNLYAYGSQLLQQNKTTPAAGGGAACDGGTPPENFPNVRTS